MAEHFAPDYFCQGACGGSRVSSFQWRVKLLCLAKEKFKGFVKADGVAVAGYPLTRNDSHFVSRLRR